MSHVDVSKLSYAELKALSKQLEEQIAAKRGEELKVLADGFARKLEAVGFTVAEGVDALQPYLGSVPKRSRTTAGQTAAVLYRDPTNPDNTWSGRGRAAGWLAQYEAQGRSREEFKV